MMLSLHCGEYGFLQLCKETIALYLLYCFLLISAKSGMCYCSSNRQNIHFAKFDIHQKYYQKSHKNLQNSLFFKNYPFLSHTIHFYSFLLYALYVTYGHYEVIPSWLGSLTLHKILKLSYISYKISLVTLFL